MAAHDYRQAADWYQKAVSREQSRQIRQDYIQMIRHLTVFDFNAGNLDIMAGLCKNKKIPVIISGQPEFTLMPAEHIAEKHKIVLALETMFNADQIGMVVDKIDSPYVKVYYDTGNLCNRGYDVPAELRQLGDRIGMIHAKDTDRQMLGGGKVDFDGVSDAIREIGYDGYIVLETPTGDDPNTANAQNLAFIKRL